MYDKEEAIKIFIKKLDLLNAKSYETEIILINNSENDSYDQFKFHYNQWWKMNKVIKIPRNTIYPFPIGNGNIPEDRHSKEYFLLLSVLSFLGIKNTISTEGNKNGK